MIWLMTFYNVYLGKLKGYARFVIYGALIINALHDFVAR